MTDGTDGSVVDTGNPDSKPWIEGIEDGELRGFLENKGLHKLDDPIKAVAATGKMYHNIEKLLGADRAGKTVILPTDGDDASKEAFYEKIGRPAAPADYGFKAAEGQSPEFITAYSEWAHKNGLTKEQATNLMAEFSTFTTSQMEALNQQAEQDDKVATEQQTTKLKGEWGQQFDKNVSLAQRAAKTFEVGDEELNGIEKVIGFERTMKLFSKIGKELGEDRFVGGNDVDTTHAASAKVTALESDPAFMKRFMAGEQGAVTEMNKWRAKAVSNG